jgi:hypothetical protein
MADKYGMVETMTRTYRTMQCAVDAGLRHAKSTGNPCYVGMLLNCKFYIADESPERDWRWETYLECLPNGKTNLKGARR